MKWVSVFGISVLRESAFGIWAWAHREAARARVNKRDMAIQLSHKLPRVQMDADTKEYKIGRANEAIAVIHWPFGDKECIGVSSVRLYCHASCISGGNE